jgi:hypothetical protein
MPGSIHPFRPPSRRTLRRMSAGAASTPPVSQPAENERRERIAAKRERQARLDADREARALLRREQRARALPAAARSALETRAGLLFPWDMLKVERTLSARLSGQPEGALFSIFDLAIWFAGVNLGCAPKEIGAPSAIADFIALSAPRTRSWPEVARTAGFFITAQAFAGRAVDRADLMDQARAAAKALEVRLAELPEWLVVHQLRAPWFIIRPKPETAAEMWKEVEEMRALVDA